MTTGMAALVASVTGYTAGCGSFGTAAAVIALASVGSAWVPSSTSAAAPAVVDPPGLLKSSWRCAGRVRCTTRTPDWVPTSAAAVISASDRVAPPTNGLAERYVVTVSELPRIEP